MNEESEGRSGAAVGRYFERQHEVFRDVAVRHCADGVSVGLFYERDPLVFSLLKQPADALIDEHERRWRSRSNRFGVVKQRLIWMTPRSSPTDI